MAMGRPPAIRKQANSLGKSEKYLLLEQLHKHQWEVRAVAAELGRPNSVVYKSMLRLGIPTMTELLSFEYAGVIATVEQHAVRLGISPKTAARRYKRGLPIEECLTPAGDDK